MINNKNQLQTILLANENENPNQVIQKNPSEIIILASQKNNTKSLKNFGTNTQDSIDNTSEVIE